MVKYVTICKIIKSVEGGAARLRQKKEGATTMEAGLTKELIEIYCLGCERYLCSAPAGSLTRCPDCMTWTATEVLQQESLKVAGVDVKCH